MHRAGRAFTLIELAAVVAVVALLAVLLPMAGRARQGDQLATSLSNMRKILQGTQHYRDDHAGQVPMRACGYSLGQVIGGWDTWNVGGKNCDSRRPYWDVNYSGVFDEPAYCRFLNAYVDGRTFNRPLGYASGGSGSTWMFSHGRPLQTDRANVELLTFKSPGDVQTQQRPSPGLSCYDDVGSSYLLNMKWWHQVFGAGIPGVSTYSSAYIYGAQHVALALDTNPDFVFMSDQVAGAVSGSSLGLSLPGEFGGTNMSVLGYADGRAAYVQIVPGAVSGPGYTFGLPGLLTATPVPTTDELP